MVAPQQKNIKKAQKEALLLREIASLIWQIAADDSRLQDIFVNRVELSPDKSRCYIFFYTPLGLDKFQELLSILILYKPSLRSAIAQRIQARYTPELVFKFDEQLEKQQRIDALLEKVKAEDALLHEKDES